MGKRSMAAGVSRIYDSCSFSVVLGIRTATRVRTAAVMAAAKLNLRGDSYRRERDTMTLDTASLTTRWNVSDSMRRLHGPGRQSTRRCWS